MNFLEQDNKNQCLLVVGMAGSGKSTFTLKNTLLEHKLSPYIINLDPAVNFLPYTPDFDIRNIIDYQKTMKDYKLGPNGTIMTCLNIMVSKIDLLIETVKKNSTKEGRVFILDTPGQIEVFNWSASGQIISSSLANTLPTSVLFIADVIRCQNPNTFMSNMLFCCSVLFRTKLPIEIIFNKSDKDQLKKQKIWMEDYQSFLDELKNYDKLYLSALSRSLCFALDDFYTKLQSRYVSSLTGEGMKELMNDLENLKQEYYDVYFKDLMQELKNLKLKKDEIIEEKVKKFQENFKE